MVRLFAQLPDYHVQLFDESYGMKSDMEYVIKDSRGFIWLASNEVVYRFDGKSIKEIPLYENLNTIFCDSYDNIWVNSSRTVYQFKNDLAGFVPLQLDSTELFSFGRIFQLPGKEVWLQSSNGFYEWNRQKQKFQKIDLSEFGVPSKIVTSLFSSFDNSIFFASGDSRSRTFNESVAISPPSSSPGTTSLRKLRCRRETPRSTRRRQSARR